MILALHRRLHHKRADELRVLLRRAGVPIATLAHVEAALEGCIECRRWAQVGAKPAIKSRISARFNQLVYGDIVFVVEPPSMFLLLLDDAIRWTSVWYIDYKNTQSLIQAVRRSWLAQYGPTQRLRSDKEGALASEWSVV